MIDEVILGRLIPDVRNPHLDFWPHSSDQIHLNPQWICRRPMENVHHHLPDKRVSWTTALARLLSIAHRQTEPKFTLDATESICYTLSHPISYFKQLCVDPETK